MPYETFDKNTASPTDRVAWALCQIIDDDAPLRWTRYRGVVECIAKNPEVMADLEMIAGQGKAAQGGVTEAMVERAFQAMDAVFAAKWPDREPLDDAEKALACEGLRAAIEAALSAEPAAQGDAWSRRMAAAETGLYVGAGAHGIEDRPAPPAQPAERVPEVNWLADQLCDLRNQWAEGCEANWLETDDNHPDDWMAKELRKRWLAASPAPSGVKGVDRED